MEYLSVNESLGRDNGQYVLQFSVDDEFMATKIGTNLLMYLRGRIGFTIDVRSVGDVVKINYWDKKYKGIILQSIRDIMGGIEINLV